ncbi:hypothetical protein D7X99_07970 [Corallococcus sp. AB032C]|uniref:hypothetical protein n=1 Tax=Corallococcus TaxID=83461 RepID=UPI000EBB77C8|nr:MULTISPECIES: hypothetical protein [Corallococcus]NPC52600.1 hypothetical protein [Corallococcus exiguus]RKH84782.1 hypothetical protein D7X99_07970 [Corallococcus sp. AB032C]
MSPPLATYSFLPWLRSGLANEITSADQDPNQKLRVQVQVRLALVGTRPDGTTVTQPLSRDVALFGPGDIQGVDTRAIVRTDPRPWITNFEPNHLPLVEFYDEDFPWRYTPAAPDAARGRLRPWLMLVVLTEAEFQDGADVAGKPLPYIDVEDFSVFPPADQLWAWAHVHVNRSLAGSDGEFTSNDMSAVLPRLQAVLDENPDLACSRIVCPRKLSGNSGYHAFLVPVFESGRLTGLGLDPAQSPHATFSAWDPAYPSGTRQAPTLFPYFYRWYFRTAADGDFETLVRLLKARPVDIRVGRRDLDVSDPGSNVRGQVDPTLGSVLKLGGALRVPREDYTPEELAELDRYENWATPFPRPIQQDLAALVDLADDYAAAAAADANAGTGLGEGVEDNPDPLVTPPLYGMWHALTKRLLTNRDGTPVTPVDNWVHGLNLDPRHRVTAGFGTSVIQQGQETYMEAAWDQVGQVLEANRRIRLGHLALQQGLVWFDRQLTPLLGESHERTLLLMAPLAKRVLASPTTVNAVLAGSRVQPTMTSAALRRVARPRGRLIRSLPFDAERPLDALVERVNAGEVSAAPPKVAPPGVTTVDQVAASASPAGVPAWLLALLVRWPWLEWGPLVLALLLALLLFALSPVLGVLLGGLLIVAGVVLRSVFARWAGAARAAGALSEAGQTPESVARLPGSADFVLTEPGAPLTATVGGVDNPEAVRFKTALRDGFALMQVSTGAGPVPVRAALDLVTLTRGMLTKLDPSLTVPRRVLAGVFLPPRITVEQVDPFTEVMAYPVIDAPMYKPLAALSSELFLPNVNFIAPNSITLLETNQVFIEAYMVGLNHEFARELLWREYPTDQRGSPFRQFWDVSSYFDPQQTDDAALREQLRDIPPLNLWPLASKLGEHDARAPPGNNSAQAVLVIRGELLKRYPTAVIYAHRAVWQLKPDGSIDPSQERQLATLTDEEAANPPRTKVRTPLYDARVDPDIYFFGFDLTVAEAEGGTGENPNDDPGWFFVIKERPGDPRFGLDTDAEPVLNVWNDLSWQDVQPGPTGSFIDVSSTTPTLTLVPPTGPDAAEKLPQYSDDLHVSWSGDMSAADVAYILFQTPVLVAVHASEMLNRES